MNRAIQTAVRYLWALAIVALASGLADLVARLTGTSRLTSIFLSAVLLAAFYLGRGPGYLTAAVASLAHLYLIDPPYRFRIGSVDEANALLLFLCASGLICLLAGRVRQTELRIPSSDLRADFARELARLTTHLNPLRHFGNEPQCAAKDPRPI